MYTLTINLYMQHLKFHSLSTTLIFHSAGLGLHLALCSKIIPEELETSWNAGGCILIGMSKKNALSTVISLCPRHYFL